MLKMKIKEKNLINSYKAKIKYVTNHIVYH
jgi:hypothetical protein